MRMGMIGLGRMGGNMVRRLRRGGVEVVGHDRDEASVRELARECDLSAAASLRDLVKKLHPPRIAWLMLPAGDVTQQCIDELAAILDRGDLVVDGANSHFEDSMRRGRELAGLGIEFVDAGVSGGVWGLERGYSLMVGGSEAAFERVRPLIEVLAPAHDRGWTHTGPVGSGHFVKMVHNGIEYGMMQAYAEGFALMRAAGDWPLDLAAIAETWRHGSVVQSWLLDLTAGFLDQDQELADIAPYVADSGEGRWTAIAAIERGVPAPVMSLALMMRLATQGRDDYAARVLAKMRHAFGGHSTKSNLPN